MEVVGAGQEAVLKLGVPLVNLPHGETIEERIGKAPPRFPQTSQGQTSTRLLLLSPGEGS